jgi:hypothetical protein
LLRAAVVLVGIRVSFGVEKRRLAAGVT